MKNFIFCLSAFIALACPIFGQDTLWFYNVHSNDMPACYTSDEIYSYVITSRIAYSSDAGLILVSKYPKDFDKVIERYIENIENGGLEKNVTDSICFYNLIIYVPNDSYVNAIVFDRESEKIRIAIFCEDGLWLEESCSSIFEEFTNCEFVEMISSQNDTEEEEPGLVSQTKLSP